MSDRVAVFDTTLRDGEQAAGTRLGSREKLMIARQLARLKVDIVEAGYPASSPEGFEAVQLLAQEIEGPVICALSRAVPSGIEAHGKALAKARLPRTHTGIGVSDIHVAGEFRDERYGINLAGEESHHAGHGRRSGQAGQGLVTDVEFYAEDAGRADPSYLLLSFRNAGGSHRGRSRGQYPGHHRTHRAGAIWRAHPRGPREHP
jgi:2-isopropylmalate synthase